MLVCCALREAERERACQRGRRGPHWERAPQDMRNRRSLVLTDYWPYAVLHALLGLIIAFGFGEDYSAWARRGHEIARVGHYCLLTFTRRVNYGSKCKCHVRHHAMTSKSFCCETLFLVRCTYSSRTLAVHHTVALNTTSTHHSSEGK